MNSELQGCSVTFPRSQRVDRKAREAMSLAISAHIGHFAYITMQICVVCVCVFKKPSKTDGVQRIRILCCCLLANFNLRWFHLRSGGGWMDVGKGGR